MPFRVSSVQSKTHRLGFWTLGFGGLAWTLACTDSGRALGPQTAPSSERYCSGADAGCTSGGDATVPGADAASLKDASATTSEGSGATTGPKDAGGASESGADTAPGNSMAVDAGDAASSVPLDASPPDDVSAPFVWQLPPGFPAPVVPEDNPMSAAKVELGRYLFYDKRLSHNETTSCATCHRQELAFTDGRAVSIGASGHSTPRSSMGLANVAYASTLTWANPLQLQLERQALVPMFGDDPIELGLGSEAALEARLRDIPMYQELFDAAFPTDADPITTRAVVQALAAFERTLISGRSAFDRYLYDKDSKALSAAAQRGYELFNSEKLECFHCHVGFNLSDHVNYAGKAFFDRPYHNTGLYNIDGEGAYPAPNTGIFSVTGEAADMGRFKAPSLRNIAVTAPYMHDGSIATLSEVLDHYAAGGRTIASGEFAGNGSLSPLKSNLIAGFELSDDERASVLAFFESLTDLEFLSDERFSDPWPRIAAGAR